MPDCTAETKNVVLRLAHEICTQIELHYLADEMAQCAACLVPLYLARPFGPLPEEVEQTIAKIEQAVTALPHYRCRDCGALFHDTDDLGLVTKPHVELLDPGEIRAIGTCPVCHSDVHPSNPTE